MSTRKWLGVSWWNAAAIGIMVVGAIVSATLGQWWAALVLVGAAGFALLMARRARSGKASDVTRLNAIEFADERDRAMATYALAAVGIVALVLSLVIFLIAVITVERSQPIFWALWGQVMVLTMVWSLANWIAARRS